MDSSTQTFTAWTNSFGRHGVSLGDVQVASFASRELADLMVEAVNEMRDLRSAFNVSIKDYIAAISKATGEDR